MIRYNRDVNDRKDTGAVRSDRHRWPVQKYRLGHEPGDDLSGTTTAEERLAMMWPLTLEAWALAGLEIPTYDRGEAVVRVIRPA